MVASEINILDSYLCNLLKERDYIIFLSELKNKKENIYSKFLDGLNQILIYKNSLPLLREYLASYNFERFDTFSLYFKIMNSIPDYIDMLAEAHFMGNQTSASNYLLEKNNQHFLDTFSYLKNLDTVFLKEGRKTLKNHLLSLDKLDELELTEDELYNAFNILEERDKLKEKFKKHEPTHQFEPVKVTNIDYGKAEYKVSSVGRNIFSRKTYYRRDNQKINLNHFIKYAVAAALIGAIIGGSYIGFFNNSNDNQSNTAQKDNINSSKPLLADIELPNLIESTETLKSILIDQRGSGFASSIKEKDSITIISKGISKQLDTLKSLLDLSTAINEIEMRKKISYQLDSLTSLFNTYTYNNDLKRITLNLNYRINVNNIVLLKPMSPKDLYIKLNDNYYLIIISESPRKLTPVTDKNKLEELQKIEFLNE